VSNQDFQVSTREMVASDGPALERFTLNTTSVPEGKSIGLRFDKKERKQEDHSPAT